jgi:uncharacterized membrane protein YkvA (DUF1232 family)
MVVGGQGMFGRFKIVPELYRTGRLAVRLFRDPRTPLFAKAVLGAAALYLISPIDAVPDWFPLAGQADDLMVLVAGLNLFIRACPRWLVDEHERRMGGNRPDDPVRRDPQGPTVVEGRYRPVD